MVKFKSPKMKRKKKAREQPEASSTPLMEDEAPPRTSASRALRDKERESQRKERDERRSKRDQRMEDSKASKASSKSKSKKKSKPKLSQEEQDLKDAKLGCCTKFAQFLAKLIHVLDGLIGLTFVVYGSLILTQFETPAMEAVYTTLIYGSALLFASIMGVVGFYSSKCNRIGLSISAYTAPFIAFFYIFVIIALLASPDTYFDYLTEHKDVLYLNDAEIDTLRQILPFFYIALACLAAMEICRFFGLRKLRHALVRHDDASERIFRRSSGGSERSSLRSSRGGSLRSSTRSHRSSTRSKGSSRRSKQDTALTEPLMDDYDEELGRGGNDSSEDSDW